MGERFAKVTDIQKILSEAKTGLWIIELDDDREPRMYADSTMLELLGLEMHPAPEDCYKHWYGHIVSGHYEYVEEAVAKMISENRAEVLYPWIHPQNGLIYVRCGGMKDLNYKSGIRLEGYHQDISSTVTLEHINNSVVHMMGEHYSGIYMVDLKNDTYRGIKTPSGFRALTDNCESYSDIMNTYVDTFVAEEYKKIFLSVTEKDQVINRMMNGEQNLQCIYHNKFGSWRRVTVMPLLNKKDNNENAFFVIIVFEDQDGEIEKYSDQIISQLAVSQMYELVISTDLEFKKYNCVHYSGDILRLTHHGNFEDFHSQLLANADPEDRENLVKLYNISNYDEKNYLEGTIRLKDNNGRVHYYTYYATLLVLNIGKNILMTLRNIDIEQEQEEKQKEILLLALKAAERSNEIKNNFLTQMSHDIRTPLNAIIGMTSIASVYADDEVRVRDCSNKIAIASQHLLTMVDDVLDIAKIEKGTWDIKEEKFDLEELLQDLSSLQAQAAEKKKQKLVYQQGVLKHRNLWGDAKRLRQVLLNIIDNAIKYTPEEGQIGLSVQEVQSCRRGYAKIVFSIEDNGIGISEDFIKRIYQPFERSEDVRQTNIVGTGLGMSIVKNLVEMMRGEIKIVSELGVGSKFNVTLSFKIIEGAVEASKSNDTIGLDSLSMQSLDISKIKEEQPLLGVRILLAEDNEINLEIAKELLTISGAAVKTVVNGQEAVECLLKQVNEYDIVLMDIKMPVMDGYKAVRVIRDSGIKQLELIPIIALSANAFQDDIKKALGCGMNGYSTKPLNIFRLIKLIKKLIKKN